MDSVGFIYIVLHLNTFITAIIKEKRAMNLKEARGINGRGWWEEKEGGKQILIKVKTKKTKQNPRILFLKNGTTIL